jgi:hypothetical protein
MLTIRYQQMKSLSDQEKNRFVAQASERILELFPTETATLTTSELQDWIRKGIRLAEGYGIFLEVEVQPFLELLLHLGEDLQSSEQLLWARLTLERTDRNPMDRLESVYSELILRSRQDYA